jgi:Fe-S cluster biogenesis protein NfuA/nitrite reductase/ring-hydroxylating ferredoxin subunit
MTRPEEQAFQDRMGRIDALIERIEASPDPEVRDSAVELMQTVMDLHGASMERMLDIAWEKGEVGQEIIGEMADDDLLRSVLLLHGLHPLDLETRVTQALDRVRPYLGSHGGNVELLGVEEGIVRLRLQGSCNGCASSAMTLKLAIEESIQEHAPDIAGMEVEGVVPPPPLPASGFIPLTQVGGVSRPPVSMGRWDSLGDVSSVKEGALHLLEKGNYHILLCKLNGTFYAYDYKCPGCGQSLEAASIKATTLACPTCGNSYDAMRAGRCLNQPSLHLEPFPLLEQGGTMKIALPVVVA